MKQNQILQDYTVSILKYFKEKRQDIGNMKKKQVAVRRTNQKY